MGLGSHFRAMRGQAPRFYTLLGRGPDLPSNPGSATLVVRKGAGMYRLGLLVWLIAVAAGTVPGCGGGGDSPPPPSIVIQNPTTAPTFSTAATAVRLGGTISGASYVHLRNERTAVVEEGFVNYFQGQGTWFCDIGLAVGDNPLVATADFDGTGARTATASILVTRN